MKSVWNRCAIMACLCFYSERSLDLSLLYGSFKIAFYSAAVVDLLYLTDMYVMARVLEE